MKTKTKVIFSISIVFEILLVIALSLWLAFCVAMSTPHDPVPSRPETAKTYQASYLETKESLGNLPLPDQEYLQTNCAGYMFTLTFHQAIERKNLTAQKPETLTMFTANHNTEYYLSSQKFSYDGEVTQTDTVKGIAVKFVQKENSEKISAYFSYDGYYAVVSAENIADATAFLNAAIPDPA